MHACFYIGPRNNAWVRELFPGKSPGELPILGYRIGDVAYLTDMTELFDSSLPLLKGIKLLIIGALRHTPHKTHQTVEHAIAFSRSLSNIPTYLIHMSHQVGLHAIEEEKLPEGFHYAYDGLVLDSSSNFQPKCG